MDPMYAAMLRAGSNGPQQEQQQQLQYAPQQPMSQPQQKQQGQGMDLGPMAKLAMMFGMV